jgi:Arc/MetJ-type ribon-helix-helix transcriptional regulator
MNHARSAEAGIEKFTDKQVKAGRYDSVEDMPSAAITRLMQDDEDHDFAPGELQAIVDAGELDIARGDVLTLGEIQRDRVSFDWSNESKTPDPFEFPVIPWASSVTGCGPGPAGRNASAGVSSASVTFWTRTPGSIRCESTMPITKQTAATPAMIQFLLISKTPTSGPQLDQMRFGRVEWRDSENAGDHGECSDARSTGTAETLLNNWQTSSLSSPGTGLW